jgi:hypothetical protein
MQALRRHRFRRPSSHNEVKEVPKISKLKPERYLLATSVPMNPDRKAKIQKALDPHIRSQEDILGQEDLNSLLTKHPKTERAHYKLWIQSRLSKSWAERHFNIPHFLVPDQSQRNSVAVRAEFGQSCCSFSARVGWASPTVFVCREDRSGGQSPPYVRTFLQR